MVGVRKQGHELVPAETSEGVGGPEASGEARPRFAYEVVADPPAQRVVDVLEAIEVDEEQGEMTAGSRKREEGLMGPFLQQGPVGEPR